MSKIIMASAGTGKTYRLALEFLALLLEGVPASEILVITFTRKATQEIRERILVFLALLINEDMSSSDRIALMENLSMLRGTTEWPSDRLEWITLQRGLLQIYTIDAFTQTLFRQIAMPVMGLAQFTLVDDSLQEQALSMWLPMLIQDPDIWPKVQVLFVEKNHPVKDLNQLLKKIQYLLKNRWLLSQPVKTYVSLETEDHLQQRWSTLASGLCSTGVSLEKLLKKDYRDLIPFILDPCHAEWTTYWTTHLDELVCDEVYWSKVAYKDKDGQLEPLFRDWQESVSAAFWHRVIAPYQQTVRDLAEIVFVRYDQWIRQTHQLTYADVAYYVYRTLYDPEQGLVDIEHGEVLSPFYERLAAHYRYVLIDEFQDTSVDQWAILSPLINEVISDETQHGGFVAVGDPKQAIYSWRGGESGLLEQLSTWFPFAKRDSLDMTYRTAGQIQSTLNDYFVQCCKSRPDWHYESVQCLPSKETDGQFECQPRSGDRDEAVRGWVDTLGQRIHAGEINPAKTAILVRTNDDLDLLANLLESKGIAVAQESASSILDVGIIQPFVMLWRYLVFGRETDALAFLRSDWVGLDEIAFKTLLDAPRFDALLEWKVEWLQKTGLWGDRIRQLFQDWRIHERSLSPYQYRQIDHLLTIFDQMDVLPSVPADVADVWDILQTYRRSERFRQGVLDGQDQLTLLTVHKSKGLEFEHVIYFWDITVGAPPEQGLMVRTTYNQRYSGPEQVLLYPKTKEKALKNIGLANQILQETQRKKTLERINLHYVALTRAKRHLWIWPYLGEKEDKNFDDTDWGGSPAKDNEKLYQLMRPFITRSTGSLLVSSNSASIPEEINYSVDPALFAPHQSSANSDNTVSQLETRIRYAGFSFIKDQEWGNVVHEYLSHILVDEPAQHEKALRMCRIKYGEWLKNHKVIKALESLKGWIAQHSEWFSSRWQVYTEQLIYVEGFEYRMDRLMVDPLSRQIMIIDYKTGTLKDASQLEHYESALQALDWVRSGGYSISSQFVEVKVTRP